MDSYLTSVRPTFGGHETFVFRQGWLTKGIEAVSDNPSIFTEEDALVVLGVGKNMVRSIRHWCLALGVVEEIGDGKRASSLSVSWLGQVLLGPEGWDRYLEDIGTLWLLHWQLFANLRRSLLWTMTFSAYLGEEFTKKDLAQFISLQFERSGIRTTQGTIEREVDCCLRTYTPVRTSKGPEENLDCPLTELGLVRFVASDNVYRFNVGVKASLPVEIFGFALLTFLSKVTQRRRTVAIDECIYRFGSPGQAFKLDENSVMTYIGALEERLGGSLRLHETAGLRQVYLHESDDLDQIAFKLLQEYYAGR